MARAPAGHHSPTGSWAFYPVNLHLPPLGRVGPWTSIPNALAEPRSALRSCSSAPHKPVNRAAERSGVAGRWAHGRQPATHCTVKWLSQRAPLHPQASRVQAWQGKSARGREMASYLRGNLLHAGTSSPGKEARVGGVELNHATQLQ